MAIKSYVCLRSVTRYSLTAAWKFYKPDNCLCTMLLRVWIAVCLRTQLDWSGNPESSSRIWMISTLMLQFEEWKVILSVAWWHDHSRRNRAEGITEFLPISFLRLDISDDCWEIVGNANWRSERRSFYGDNPIGAISAAVIYFWSDIWRILQACGRGYAVEAGASKVWL